MRKFLLAVLAGLALSLGTAAVADADAPAPPCAAVDTCKYMPNPYYNGPLMPTWNLPGIYGGRTNLPVICDPQTYSCRTYVPGTR